MKNYKFLVPIFLVFLFVMSFYMLINEKIETSSNYNTYVEQARYYKDEGILVDAVSYYEMAIAENSNVDIYIELANLYLDNDEDKTALSLAEDIVDEFPNEVVGYEYLSQIYIDKNTYASFFELYDEFIQRELSSDNSEQMYESIEYEFYYNYEYADVSVYGENLVAVKKNEKWGYASTSGKLTIDCEYLYSGVFLDGLAPVIDENGDAYYIDTSGNIKQKIDNIESIVELGSMNEGIYAVYDGTSWQTDEEVFSQYENVSTFANNYIAVQSGETWSLLDIDGANVTGETYEEIVMDSKRIAVRYSRLFVKDNGEYYLIDTEGNKIGDYTFEEANLFSDSTYAAIKIDGKWGFIDSDGIMQIEPQYDDAKSFNNGFAAVEIDGKWGFINLDGELVIDAQFESVEDFNSKGCAFVYIQDCWQILKLYKYNY